MSTPADMMSPPPPPSGAPTAEEKQWAMFAHLSALLGFLIPLGSIVAPLVIWQMKKNEMPFVDDQGKEAVNFQITVFIAVVVAALLCIVLIGFLLLPIIGIGALILIIMAGLKANNGEAYRYPFALRLIK
jgi:uncharacterized Tic20 family protein